MDGIIQALPDPSDANFVVPNNSDMLDGVDANDLLLLDLYDGDSIHTIMEIYKSFEITRPEKDMIASSALQMAKLHSARENSRKRILFLKENYIASQIPKGIRCKLSGIKNQERAAEIMKDTNCKIIRAEIETHLATFASRNARYCELYSTLITKLKLVNDSIAVSPAAVTNQAIAFPGVPVGVLTPEGLTSPLIRKLLGSHCALNPRTRLFTSLYNSQLAMFALNDLNHKEKAKLTEDKKNEKRRKLFEATAAKASKVFTALNANSIDEKLALLAGALPKNGRGKEPAAPLTRNRQTRKNKSPSTNQQKKPENVPKKGKPPSPHKEQKRKGGKK